MDTEDNVPLLPESHLQLTANASHRIIKKLDYRFLSLLVGLVFIVYANRGSIGYVAPELCVAFDLTNEEYGKSVSAFHFGYILTQVVGNILLSRLGAPVWLSLISLFGGVISVALGFIQTMTQFYMLRALQGMAEGGTFPAVWYLVTVFYPPEHITKPYSVLSFSESLTAPISSPISAGLLSLGDYVGVEGWRLLFIVEGLVPFLYSTILYFCMPASVETASFLKADEKEWIAVEQEREDSAACLTFWQEVKAVVANGSWWVCTFWGLCDFGISSVLLFWATLLIHDIIYPGETESDFKGCGLRNATAVLPILLTAIPFLVAAVSCLLICRYNAKNRSRSVSIFSCLAGASLVLWAVLPSWFVVPRFLLLTCTTTMQTIAFVYVIGLMMVTSDASVRSTAASLFNAVSTIGAIVFPFVFGKIIDAAGTEVAIAVSGGTYIFLSFLIIWVKDPQAMAASDDMCIDEGVA